MKRALLVATFLAAGCASMQPAPAPAPASITASSTAAPCRASDATINATLWLQTSAEYTAITREVYGTALRTLDAALADPAWTALVEQSATASKLPPAIILDIDETVLDTSAHQGQLIHANTTYSEAEWHEYAMHDISRPIKAALDFVKQAHGRGIAVFYITNRYASETGAVRATLERYGYPFDAGVETLLVRGEGQPSDKSPRRNFVAGKYRVLALFGDDLNDFLSAAGKSVGDRDALVDQYNENWGRKWFVLPNPVYGSWERSMLGNPRGLFPCQEFQKKIETVREQ